MAVDVFGVVVEFFEVVVGVGRSLFFNQLRSVWISDETFFRVFDIASQSIHDS